MTPLITPTNALQVAQNQIKSSTPVSAQTTQSISGGGTSSWVQLSSYNQATQWMNVADRVAYRNSLNTPTNKNGSVPAQTIPAVTPKQSVIQPVSLGSTTTQKQDNLSAGTVPKDGWLDTSFYGQKKPTTPSVLGTPKTTTGQQPVAPTTPDVYTSANAKQKADADALMSSLDPTGVMDQNMKNDLRNAYISGDIAKVQAYANQNNLDTSNIQGFINAYRTTRDTALQQEKQAQDVDLQTQRTVQEFDTQIESQKQNIRKQQLANDMMMSTSGRGMSQNLSDTIVQELTMQQTILRNLHQSKDWALQGIAQQSAYASKILANNYNDTMSQYSVAIQNQMKTLEDTGLSKTAEGLMAMRSTIEQTNLDKLALSQTYAQQLQFLTEQMKTKAENSKFDATQTAWYNDGYLHNANGEVIYWPNGKPFAYNPTKELKTTVSDGKGGIIGIYSDGTHAPIYEGTQATPEELKTYAQAIINAGENGGTLLSALPDHIKSQVVEYIGKQWWQFGQQEVKPEWKTWKDAQWVEHSGWLKPWQNPESMETGGNVSMAEFIKWKEWFRAQAYDDFDGHTLAPGETPKWTATIWYGTTSINGKPIVWGQTISQEQANELFNEQVKGYQKWANLIDPTKLNESQKTALTSLEYNAWGWVWQYPAGQKIIQQINNGDFAWAAKTLVNSWIATTNAKTGEKLKWLVNRRAEEAKLLSSNSWNEDGEINAIIKWDATLPSANQKKGAETRQKMASMWLFSQWKWNEAFYELKPKDRQEIVDVTKMDDDLSKIEELVRKHEEAWDLDSMLWFADAPLERAKWKTGMYSDDEYRADFNTLDTLLGKNIANYLKSTSGLTVSEKEREALLKLLPNLDQSEDQFKQNLKLFREWVNRNTNERLTTFGFDSLDSMREKTWTNTDKKWQETWKTIYTDDDWVEYTAQSLQDELNRAIDNGTLTEESARQWIKDNNITF